ncbi:BTAD domain-containing putative transcriptional regulator [Streptomyces diastatochromogenes]|uniref:AfsR/SARP family transcriptional regulator n=1 Tax=Streptomyces diastatochromogenes TaxID=42236 RepID=UPI002F26A3CD
MPIPSLEFRILGPVQVRIDGTPMSLTGKQRALATTLLLDANRVVSADRIALCLWGNSLPSAPASRVRSLISELRRILREASTERIRTVHPGYCLHVLPGELDVHSFEEGIRRANKHAGEGFELKALESYTDALKLWRGIPMKNIDGENFNTEVQRLKELYISAMEGRARVNIRLGHLQEAVSELRQIMEAEPFREPPVEQLMIALERSGRTAEALNIYRVYRTTLIKELGIEPSAELSHTQQRILQKGYPRKTKSYSEVSQSRPIPRNLPMAPIGMVGRTAELKLLNETKNRARRIILIVGPAGVGKSALAVHWAHQVADQFPDGQLYLEMRGFDHGQPCSAAEALPQLLQLLGYVSTDIPVDFQEQLALYRSSLADKKVLILFDDVSDVSQVRPLIPGSAGCVVIVTSRDRLGSLVALEGAERVTLQGLNSSESIHLIALRAGGMRVRKEPEAAIRLADLCGKLPLALCIVGAQLADHPYRTIRQHIEGLMSDGLLDHLHVDSDSRAAVRPALDMSYNTLSRDAQHLLHLFALVPGSNLPAHAASALADISLERAVELLDSIARIHLTSEIETQRYSCHDLVLEYAAEKGVEVNSNISEKALGRFFDFYLHSLISANRASSLHELSLPYSPPIGVTPMHFASKSSAHEWIALEWDNIAAIIVHVAERGPHHYSWLFVATLQDIFHHWRPISEWIYYATLAQSAARNANDALGQSAMHKALASALWRTGDLQFALAEYDQALHFARQAHWKQGECAALLGSGVARKQLGNPESSLTQYKKALEISRELDDQRSQAIALSNLASVHLTLSQLEVAEQFLVAALPLARISGHRHLEALVLSTWGHVQQKLAFLDEAVGTLEESISVARSIDSAYAEAASLETLGRVHHDAGRYVAAVKAFEQALGITRRVGNRNCEVDALCGLAATRMKMASPTTAAECLMAAQDTAEETGHAAGLVETLLGKAELAEHTGSLETAWARASEALQMASSKVPLMLPRAHYVMACVLLARENPEQAIDRFEEALDLSRRSQQRLLQVRTLIALGQALRKLQRLPEACAAWREAESLVTALGAPERAEVKLLLADPDLHA